MRTLNIICLIFSILFIPITLCNATAIDLSWSTLENFDYSDKSEKESLFLVWHYNVENTTDKTMPIPINIYLTTNTSDRHEDIYNEEILESLTERDKLVKRYEHAQTVRGKIDPKESRKCVAIFENIDPDSKKIHIFVLGLRHFAFWRPAQREYIYRITYKRSLNDTWRLIEHGFSKETTARYRTFE